MERKRIRLNILGTDYLISTEEEEEYVRSIAMEVEKRINEEIEGNSRISAMMAAVLTSLDYCDEAKKALASADNLRSQIKDYLEDSSRARMEADEARREIERMKKEIQTLRSRLAESDTAAQPAAHTPNAQAAPAPISRPAPSDSHVPQQARIYSKPEPVSDKADEEIMNFFEKQPEKK